MSLLRSVESTLKDNAGRSVGVSTFQDLIVGSRKPNINVNFVYQNSNQASVVFLNSTIFSSSGTAIQSNSDGVAYLESGTGVGTAEIRSVAINRYIPGQGNVDFQTMVFPDGGEAGVDMAVGYGSINSDDFIGYGYQGTEFGIFVKLKGVEDFKPQSEWNQNTLEAGNFIIDPTKMNIQTKSFGYLGIADIIFGINQSIYDWTTTHVVQSANLQAEPHMSNPSAPCSMWIRRNAGTGANIRVGTSSWFAGTIGDRAAGTGSDKTPLWERNGILIPANTETVLMSLYNKTTYQSKTNSIRTRYGTLTITSDGNKSVSFKVYKNGVDRNVGTWGDFDTNGSVIEINIDSPLALTTRSPIPGITLVNEQIGSTALGKVDRDRINLFSTDVVIDAYPGESITITAFSQNNTEVDIQLRWIEEA